ncbi:MAG: 5'/3'-nucleotidase SurE [Hyphomicrobiaceae bacterium]|nr:MAG: 5'/3'-nucleotidase SurE [Hyphomicrobiaceae bacterium]
MRTLIANDDGIDAPGLAFLRQAAARLSQSITVVAPERKWTAASHQLSFDKELTLTQRGEGLYACSGSPADAIVAAMTILARNQPKPDLVLAGVNDGRNTGEDCAYSGTLAIAREATFWGVPAIAFSRTKGGAMGEPEIAALAELISRLWHNRASWVARGVWLSVNLPRALPAEAGEARIGSDKIAGAVDILSETSERVTWRLRRGRPRHNRPGDENDLLERGMIAIARHRWDASDPLDPAVISALNERRSASAALPPR